MPPTYMDASPWTTVIGLPSGNQRGPGVPWMRSRWRGPSGPATRSNRARPSRSRIPTPPSLRATGERAAQASASRME
jgi:hypothetical protein